MAIDAPLKIGEPALRWSARAHSIAEIESELARIWSSQDLTTDIDGEPGRHIAARTSVMNLVVIARRPELAERCAATIQALTGRHPSRTIVIQSADPDGPSWLDARVEAHCVLPREDAPETCAETIHVTCGGEAGHHLAAIATPLIIHDLPVTVWWPGEPPLTSRAARDLLATADRLVVDGSTWSGDGLAKLRELASLQESSRLAISDFALVRQSRWREAIASIFDDPGLPALPALAAPHRRHLRDARRDRRAGLDQPGQADLSRRLARLAAGPVGGQAARPVAGRGPVAAATPGRAGRPRPAGSRPVMGRGLVATLSDGRAEVAVVARPVVSAMPAGTTLRIELLAERRGSELRADVTAEAETVRVRVWQDGVECWDRPFRAPRRTDVDLLAEAIEAGQRDPVAVGALRSAAALVGAGRPR